MVTLYEVLHIRCMRDCARLAMMTNLMMQPLAAIGQVKQLSFLVKDPSIGIRYFAVTALAGTGAQGVPALIEALGAHQPSMIRCAAIQALMYNEKTASPALPMLAECMSSPDAVVRDQACHALAKIGAPSYPVIREALRSPNYVTQAAAATALSRCGPGAVELVDELRVIRMQAPKNAMPSLIAAEMRLTGDTSAGMTHFVELLRDPNHGVREAAVRAAGELGPLGAPLQAVLMGAVRDPSIAVRAELSKSIVKIAPNSPLTQDVLRHLANDHDPSVRSSAMIILPGMGFQAQQVIDQKLRESTGHDLAFARSAKFRLTEAMRPPVWHTSLQERTTQGPLRPLDEMLRKI